MNDLLRRLDELGAELKVRDRPERRAWNRLEPTRNGWTTRLYDDQAFTLWQEVLRRFPDDLSTVHHLAIMHHARAIDVEQSAHPGRSDEDWRQALALWNRLFTVDEFWTELAEGVDATPELVPQVREEFAERLLGMHFDIALDEKSPHHRARFHVQLALAAPFPRDLVERVRGRAYERAIEGVDPGVWSNSVEAEQLWPAIEIVTHYLDLDDDCAPALKDLLKLLRQAQARQVHHANGLTDKRENRRALDDIRATTRKFDTYVTRVEPLLFMESEQDTLALSDLAVWLSLAAQASNARQAHDEAAGYYDRALRAALAADDPRAEEFRVERLFAIVLSAREHAANNKTKAQEVLAGIEKSERLPGIVLLTRAQAWLLIDDLAKADADAEAAASAFESPRPDAPFLDVADPAELRAECLRLREQIERVRTAELVSPWMDAAATAAKAHRLPEAIEQLNEVLKIDKNYTPALVRRAECRLGQYELDAAKIDLDQAERLIRGAGGDERALQAVQQLRQKHRARRRLVTEVGGPKAARLQQEGIRAFNDGQYEQAIELLRKARTAAGARVPKLDEGLALSLNAQAHKLVELITNVLGSPFSSSPYGGRRGLLDNNPFSLSELGSGPLGRAERLLEEAVRLHPTETIRQNLEQVRLIRQRLGDTW